MMEKYSINIVWSEKDKEFIATCPSFPGLSAFGETEEEAISEAKIALELFVESYKRRGLSLPKPATSGEYSGQFRLRLSPTLHRQASELAASEGQSLNTFISHAVQAHISTLLTASRVMNDVADQVSAQITANFVHALLSEAARPNFRNRFETSISAKRSFSGESALQAYGVKTFDDYSKLTVAVRDPSSPAVAVDHLEIDETTGIYS